MAFALDEKRIPMWGTIAVPASSRSCGSLRPEPEGSQVEGGMIDVAAVVADAGVAKAGVIAVAKSAARQPL